MAKIKNSKIEDQIAIDIEKLKGDLISIAYSNDIRLEVMCKKLLSMGDIWVVLCRDYDEAARCRALISERRIEFVSFEHIYYTWFIDRSVWIKDFPSLTATKEDSFLRSVKLKTSGSEKKNILITNSTLLDENTIKNITNIFGIELNIINVHNSNFRVHIYAYNPKEYLVDHKFPHMVYDEGLVTVGESCATLTCGMVKKDFDGDDILEYAINHRKILYQREMIYLNNVYIKRLIKSRKDKVSEYIKKLVECSNKKIIDNLSALFFPSHGDAIIICESDSLMNSINSSMSVYESLEYFYKGLLRYVAIKNTTKIDYSQTFNWVILQDVSHNSLVQARDILDANKDCKLIVLTYNKDEILSTEINRVMSIACPSPDDRYRVINGKNNFDLFISLHSDMPF